MVVQDDQSTTTSTHICPSVAPPKETLLPVPKPPIWLMAFSIQKTGFEMSIHDMANRWTPKINYGKKRVIVICSNTPITQEKTILENHGPSKNYLKKVQITSGKF